MKKGFTLVELLAVISALAILLVLIVPTVIRVVNDSKQKAYDLQVNSIKTAAKFYVEDNKINIESFRSINTPFYITLGDLETNGYIDTPIVSPLTNRDLDLETTYVEAYKNFNNKIVYNVVDSSNTTTFNKTFGGTNIEESGNHYKQSVLKLADGGYLIFANTTSSDGDLTTPTHGGFDIWVVKLSETGEKEWDKTYGGTGDDYIYDVFEMSGGNIAIIGNSTSSDGDIPTNKGGMDLLFMQIDKDGTLLSVNTYGGSLDDFGVSFCETNDHYYLTGNSYSTDGDITDGNQGLKDFLIIKTDKNGVYVDDKTYGGTATEYLRETFFIDGYLYLFGDIQSSDGDVTAIKQGDWDVGFIKLNLDLEVKEQYAFGGSGYDRLDSAVLLSDGNFIISSKTESIDGDIDNGGSLIGTRDFWLLKVDSSGNVIWSETYGGTALNEGGRVLEKPNGNIIAVYKTSSIDLDALGNHGGYDIIISEIDSTGSLLTSLPIGGSLGELNPEVSLGNDGGIVLLIEAHSSDGDIIDGNYGNGDLWVVKTTNDFSF